MIPYYRQAGFGDVFDLAPRMRQADVDEVLARSGRDPKDALLAGLRNSDPALTLVGAEGEVVGMAGVVPGAPGRGAPWMLCSDEIKRYAPTLVREGRKLIADWLRRYGTLMNFVDARNTVHIRWLELMGFKLGPAAPLGVNGELFLPFYRQPLIVVERPVLQLAHV